MLNDDGNLLYPLSCYRCQDPTPAGSGGHQTDTGDSAAERVVNLAWITEDDRTPQYLGEGTTQDQVQVAEVKTELDPEAMDDLVRDVSSAT